MPQNKSGFIRTFHAEEEMAEDGFERSDIERAIIEGFVEKITNN